MNLRILKARCCCTNKRGRTRQTSKWRSHTAAGASWSGTGVRWERGGAYSRMTSPAAGNCGRPQRSARVGDYVYVSTPRGGGLATLLLRTRTFASGVSRTSRKSERPRKAVKRSAHPGGHSRDSQAVPGSIQIATGRSTVFPSPRNGQGSATRWSSAQVASGWCGAPNRELSWSWTRSSSIATCRVWIRDTCHVHPADSWRQDANPKGRHCPCRCPRRHGRLGNLVHAAETGNQFTSPLAHLFSQRVARQTAAPPTHVKSPPSNIVKLSRPGAGPGQPGVHPCRLI